MNTRSSQASKANPATLIGLDSRLDIALLSDNVSGRATGSALADALAAGERPPAHLGALHVVGFGQLGRAVYEPVTVAVHLSGVLQGVGEIPLLSLTGPLVAGTSGSPVLDEHEKSWGMVVGQVRRDRTHGIGVRSADLLRFLDYFGVVGVLRPNGRSAAHAVLVQCVD